MKRLLLIMLTAVMVMLTACTPLGLSASAFLSKTKTERVHLLSNTEIIAQYQLLSAQVREADSDENCEDLKSADDGRGNKLSNTYKNNDAYCAQDMEA